MVTREDVLHRQRSLGLYVPAVATVIGVGGTGSWVAYVLALAGTQEMLLYDGDRVESHNLNRLPLPLSAIDRPKVEALADEIIRLRPEIVVVPYFRMWSPEDAEFSMRGDVFDCTDRNSVQQQIADACNKHGLSYNRSGCDAETMTSTNFLPWKMREGDGLGYGTEVPQWASPPMIAAAYTVGTLLAGWPVFSGQIRRRV